MICPLQRIGVIGTLLLIALVWFESARAQTESVAGPSNAFYFWANGFAENGLYVGVLSTSEVLALIQAHDRTQSVCELLRNDFTTLYCVDESNSFHSYDAITGDETVINVGASDPGAGFGEWEGMATDPTSGTVYTLASEFESGFGSLWTIDVGTGFVSFVGFTEELTGLAFDLAGQLYGVKSGIGTDTLFAVDKSIGTPTFVGLTGANESAWRMDLDEDDGTVYAAAVPIGDLHTVNPNTGAFNMVGEIGSTFPTSTHGPIAIAALNQNLPVELVSFDALVDQRAVVLTWQTASEDNNAGFEIEQRPGGATSPESESDQWKSIAFVDGHGTTDDPQSYTHRIVDLSSGSHRFRLKQIDFDGAFEYSEVIEVTTDVSHGFVLEAAYPNPFNPATTIRFVVGADMPVSLDVFDTRGRLIDRLYNAVAPAGVNQLVSFKADDLPGGLYFYRLQTPLGSKSRSVMLLK